MVTQAPTVSQYVTRRTKDVRYARKMEDGREKIIKS